MFPGTVLSSVSSPWGNLTVISCLIISTSCQSLSRSCRWIHARHQAHSSDCLLNIVLQASISISSITCWYKWGTQVCSSYPQSTSSSSLVLPLSKSVINPVFKLHATCLLLSVFSASCIAEGHGTSSLDSWINFLVSYYFCFSVSSTCNIVNILSYKCKCCNKHTCLQCFMTFPHPQNKLWTLLSGFHGPSECRPWYLCDLPSHTDHTDILIISLKCHSCCWLHVVVRTLA